jgi:hypothetical protein
MYTAFFEANAPALMDIRALWPHQVDGPIRALTEHRLSERRYNRVRHHSSINTSQPLR